MKESDLPTLNQLVRILEDSYGKLKIAYNKKDSETFNKLKRLIIQIQRRISQILR